MVDDPIVDVENIYRHLRMRKRSRRSKPCCTAVNEVRPPIILATLAVIVSFLPMFFITGMMGPYMRPMALNVPLAMLMSLVVAFTITPWLAYRALRKHAEASRTTPRARSRSSSLYRVYARGAAAASGSARARRWALLVVIGVLFLAAASLAALPRACRSRCCPSTTRTSSRS